MIEKTTLQQLEFEKVLTFIARYCMTVPGKEIIKNIKPLNTVDDVIYQGTLVSEAKEVLIHETVPPIEHCEEISEQINTCKISGALISAKKILQIYQLCVQSRNIHNYCNEQKELAPKIANIAENLFRNKLFEHQVTNIIDESGEVKDSASKELKKIRTAIREKNNELRKQIARIMKKLADEDFVREDYVTLSEGRIVVPVKAEHKRHIKGFIHSESSTGQTVYIEPEETLNLNNEIVSLHFSEQREIDRILRSLCAKIGEYADELTYTLQLIAKIDAIYANAKYSIEIIGAFPSINKNANFFLQDARHPVLLQKIGRNKTIPFSIEVDENRINLITGPNAGGKTVLLKSIGILSLMVMSGIHIPASPDTNFHFFAEILIDIGDAQSIEDDLSTFSSHLSKIKRILSTANENSLVLLDEIGTGTDPSAGSALAAAVLLTLRNHNALVFANSHHGNLKILANEEPGFLNSSMEFDNQELCPTFHFRQGLPGSSYAFEIAKRIGFKDHFLSLASEHQSVDQNKIEQILIDIENQSQELRKKLRNAEVENSRLKGLSNLYEERNRKLEKEKREILKKTKLEAEEYLGEANKQIQNVIKEIKTSNAEKVSIKSANSTLKNLQEITEKIYTEEVDSGQKKYDFVEGDYASIKNTNTAGKIIDISKDKKTATILAGSLKLQVKYTNLIPAKKRETKKDFSTQTNIEYSIPEQRIDVRGKRPEEIEFPIVRFIDDAFTNGFERVEILHGKGTGALKKTVQDLLKAHENVKSFYFAPVEFGGEGITIAEIK